MTDTVLIFSDVDVVVTSCPLLEDCFISCQYGFVSDENGCRTCQCHEPCKVCDNLSVLCFHHHHHHQFIC